MLARKRLPTPTVVAYSLGLRRRQNGSLTTEDVQREIARDIVQNSLAILGDNILMSEKVIGWAASEQIPHPASLSYEDLGVAVALIEGYEKAKDKTSAASEPARDFPITEGKRGMLKARVLSIKERNKASDKTFANGKSWATTSHIRLEVTDPTAIDATDKDRRWQAVWYATGGKNRLSAFWNAYDSGEFLMVRATVREIPQSDSQSINLTDVREASIKQLDDFKRKQDKLVALLGSPSPA